MIVIIVSPSLNPTQNVSGISSVTQFIISNNIEKNYIHFELGKKDNEKGGIFRIKNIIGRLFKWYKLINQHPTAIVHYNFPLSKQSILRDPMFMYIARKNRMVVHIHGGNFLTALHIPNYLQRILNKVFSMSCPFIVLSDIEKKIIHEKFSCSNVHVLPNCVDLTNASKFIKQIKGVDEPLVIGYLGRIAETKGIGYLLDACIELKNRKIPFILRIAGKEEIENQYVPLFKKELGNYFYYDGIVSGELKNDFLKHLDIFLLPSYFEGLPMSLLECMSFGVVPITTNVGSIGEVVKEKQNGLFIKVKDVNSIVEQFIRLHKERELLKELAIQSKKTIFDLFNANKYVDKLNSIYHLTDIQSDSL